MSIHESCNFIAALIHVNIIIPLAAHNFLLMKFYQRTSEALGSVVC
jgi:hypothetical protein